MKKIAEHSGCGYGTQVDQMTLRLDRGDVVVQLSESEYAALRTKQPAASEGDVEALARKMFTDQADKLAAPWDRQWEPTKQHWREKATEQLNTSKQAAGEAVAGLMELADRYFSIGYAQGREGRKTDSPAFDALECRYEIESRIAAYTTPPRHPADEDAEQLSKSDKDYILRTQNLLLGFMLDCNAIGAKEAGVNLARSMKEKAALQAGTP